MESQLIETTTVCSNSVVQELRAMSEFMNIPPKAFKYASNMNNIELTSMKTSEAADLCIELSLLK